MTTITRAELATRIRALDAERERLVHQLNAVKQVDFPHRCCRCWPRAVNGEGYCGCCDWNHATGKREGTEVDDPKPAPERAS